jgi:predicted nucleic acid-binding Zn ribbon protein
MFTGSLNLESLRTCAATGCGKPLPQELALEAKFCSDECKERQEKIQQKASKG